VVFRIPFLGAVVEFVRSPIGICVVAFIYGLFLVEISLAEGGEKGKGAEKEEEEETKPSEFD